MTLSVTLPVTCPRAVRDFVRFSDHVRDLSVTVSVTCPRAVRDFFRDFVRDLSASCPGLCPCQ